MRRLTVVLFALAALGAPGLAQVVEETIYLPDSLSGTTSPQCVCYVASNHTLYVGGMYGGCVIAVDGITHEKTARIAVGSNVVAMCHNGLANKLYVANYSSGTVTVIDCATNQVLANAATGRNPTALCYDSLGNRVYCVNYGSATVSIIDGASNSVVKNVPVLSNSRSACFSPARRRLYCASYGSNRLQVIDCLLDTVVASVATRYSPVAVCYSSGSDKVYVANQFSNNVTVVDCARDTAIATVATGQVPSALAYNPLSNKVYCVNCSSSTVSVIDCTRDTVLTNVQAGVRTVRDWLRPGAEPGLLHKPEQRRLGRGLRRRRYRAGARSGRRDPVALAMSGDGTAVFTAGYQSFDVTVFDAGTMFPAAYVKLGFVPVAFCSSPLTGKVYCAVQTGAGLDGLIAVIDGTTNRVLEAAAGRGCAG